MSRFEPRGLTEDEVERLPGLAFELLRRSWWKLLGLMTALGVLGQWAMSLGGAPGMLSMFAASGLIMALGFWTARAADRWETVITLHSARVLARGAALGLILGAVYFLWGLPTTETGPGADIAAASLSLDPRPDAPLVTIPQILHASPRGEGDSVFHTGLAYARERATWLSLAAALGTLLVVAAHVFGNGLASGLVFVPIYVLGIPLSNAVSLSGWAASRNKTFTRCLFRRSPSVIMGLNVTVGLVILAPDIIGLLAPVVTLYVLYVGSLSYVTYRAIFEGRMHNGPRRAPNTQVQDGRLAAVAR